MGLMKKAARRATPRSVRKAKRTAFNITHPINTAENALLNAATPKRGRRAKSHPSPASTSSAVRPESPTIQRHDKIDPQAYRIVTNATHEHVYVVLVWPGVRTKEVANFMVRMNQGKTNLPIRGSVKLRRRRARKQLQAPPLFLLTDVRADLGQRVIAAFAELGATVQLWTDADARRPSDAQASDARKTRTT